MIDPSNNPPRVAENTPPQPMSVENHDVLLRSLVQDSAAPEETPPGAASLQRFLPLLGLGLFLLVLWVLHKQLAGHRYRDIIREAKAIPGPRLAWAFVLTVLNYLVLTGHDTLAFRYLRYPLSYPKIALAAFLSFAFSHNVGFALLSSASMRYRLYSTWGLSAGQIATVVAFNGLTFWFGALLLGGLAFVYEPLTLPSSLRLPFSLPHVLGVCFLAVVLGYFLLSALRKEPISIHGWEIPLPPPRLAAAQILLSALDWTLAGGVLYVLLPTEQPFSFPYFLGVFVLAQIAGVSSQAPGGLGVLETVVLVLLANALPTPAVLGSLLAYRGIYYLLPLAVATVMLAMHELMPRRETLGRIAAAAGRWSPIVIPQVLAISVFISGAMLLFSGATPAVHARLAWLHDFVPLSVIEASHFLGSLAGVGLLLLARGLQQRLDAAYHGTVLLLAGGIAFSLLKGGDYEDAIILAVMLGALLPCRRHFYRKASLISERFTPGWIVAIAVVILGSTWLGFFAHRHMEYANELWWRFALMSDAPRFLRATVGVFGVALLFAAAHLLRPAPPEPILPSPADLERARAIIVRSRAASAHLALLGDKALLFSDNAAAFLMYSIEGWSWVAFGDPIGPAQEHEELVWRFRELCDQHNGWPVFYEVGQNNLPLYIDLGLTLVKLGGEARVRLASFSLQGDVGKKFRRALNHVEKAGCSFAIIPAAQVGEVLPELRAVSDAWLAEKNPSEKRFSRVCFSEAYLQQGPVGVVRQEGKIIAFANLWLSADKEELSPDLLRYAPRGPNGLMDYLFFHLICWGQQEGYRWFNLGMAPLAGLGDRALAPLWNRLGAFVFRHGEHFYNFQGLRRYKEKFAPEWTPKYLACPGGLALPRILTNVASLIAGGMRGVIGR